MKGERACRRCSMCRKPGHDRRTCPERYRVQRVSLPQPVPVVTRPMLPPSPTMHRYPLGEGRHFVFVLPADGLTRGDVQRIFLHLLTLAHDFQRDTEAAP